MDTNPTSLGFCFHCGNRLSARHRAHFVAVDGKNEPVCCAGCEAAAEYILSQGLGRFYQFRRTPVSPPLPVERDWSAFDRPAALTRYTHAAADGSRELGAQLEGLHCAACVWLIENSLQRESGITDVFVNLGEGRAYLRYDPDKLPLSGVLHALHRIGYRPRPISYLGGAPDRSGERRLALKRLAVAGFGMMQVMSFAAALYAGTLDGIAPDIEQFLRYVSFLVASAVVLYSAQPFFISAWRSLRARSLGMDVPVALSIGIAYGWSVWTTLRGHGAVYFDSAVMFTFLLLLGRSLEMSLQHRAALRHDSLNRLLPETVLRLCGARAERVTPDELRCGDRIRVLAGERIPADGVICTGVAEVDESLLTGESMPRVCQAGDEVTAGTIDVNGILEVTVARVGQDSRLAEIARLVDRARAVKPPIVELADRVAGGFVGAIVLLALAAGVYWWYRDATQVLPVVLAVLVVTCPCALSLATPAALAAAGTRLSRAGLLVARSRGLERLAHVDTVIFDKTGTLTRGQPRIERVELMQQQVSSTRCLLVASALEAFSTHPVARAFATTAGGLEAVGVVTVPGRGLEGEVDGVRYRIGQADYVTEGMARLRPRVATSAQEGQSIILLGDREQLLAAFLVADTLRVEASEIVRQLQDLGLTVRIASGDREAVVRKCARQLQISEAHAEMTAATKLALLRALQIQGHRVLMVGDGINDAAILAAADVSVAVGSGADLAQVNADMVLIGESLASLPQAITTTRRMLSVMRQNLAWAAIYNLASVPLAVCGWLDPWMAAVGMSLSSLLVVINALRLLPPPSATTPLVATPQRMVVG